MAPGNGFLIVYIDNQSIGKDVWFDNLSVSHFSGSVIEESHYYPFGLTQNVTSLPTGVNKQPYKYQGIELEQHFGLEQYETVNRVIDPQLGLLRQVDSKAEKHYDFSPYVSMGDNPALNVDPLGDDWFVNTQTGGVLFVKKHYDFSPYVSMGDNPALNVDPLGDDWFVNNTTGEVVYMKNVSEVNGLEFMKAGLSIPAEQYERLGPNDMFGKEVIDSRGNNMLEGANFRVGNSEAFMTGRGYAKAERVDIEEREFTSGGSFGGEERISQTTTSLEQSGDSKITYVKPDELNKKAVIDKTFSDSPYSSISTIKYTLTKPYGQDNGKTAEFYDNRNKGLENASKDVETSGAVIDFFKALFGKH